MDALDALDAYFSSIKDEGRFHITAAPLVEMFSITIHNTAKRSLKVYGDVRVVLGEDKSTIVVYDRESDECEVVNSSEKLSLIGPNCEAISIAGSSILIHLMDLNQGTIIQGCFYFEDNTCSVVPYEKPIHKAVNGKSCSAIVHYALYPRAIMAQIEVSLHEEGKDCAMVYGNIVARSTSSEEIAMASNLFMERTKEPVKVKYESPIELLRSSVIVPAYSSLVIDVDLHDVTDGIFQIIRGCTQFECDNPEIATNEFSGNNNTVIKVNVKWSSICLSPPLLETSYAAPQQHDLDHSPLTCVEEGRKMFNIIYLDQLPLKIPRQQPSIQFSFLPGIPAIELFSIYIGYEGNEMLSVYGNIEIIDSYNPFVIFERDMDSPLMLRDRTIPITCRPNFGCFKGSGLSVMVDLKDVTGRFEVKGYIGWNLNDPSHSQSWLDTHICSVIQGNNAYAALHYTFFSSATLATVRVFLYSKTTSVVNYTVHGSIVIRYRNHHYLTKYEEDYFRTILFKESADSPFEIGEHFAQLPLTRSVLPVPMDSSLIFDLNLTGFDGGYFEDYIEFKVDEPCYEIIEGRDGCIIIVVDW